ncbi:MAG: 2,3-bisphosphoglycerate-independent phosphoglycerate mutase [Phycisphaerales bacterium]|nr:2,3-bisphosphoglycerate-independent phosphoglycerate mutase [Phycisphaerales bacterium]
MKPTKRPCILIIRDGWGANPHPEWNHANAVHLARTPVDDALMAQYPHAQIVTHGPDVGLPDGIMGNSEVGHQNIGAGRVVDQDIMHISRRIRDGSFYAIPALREVYDHAAAHGGSVHLIGLCSDAGVHSALEHLYALLESARWFEFDGDRVYLHAITDGRDSSPFSGVDFLQKIEFRMKQIGVGRIASVIGRYYAMDRDNRWDRVEKAYRMLTGGTGDRVPSAREACDRYYANPTGDSMNGDEFVTPSVIVATAAAPPVTIRDGDGVLFFNFRGDRPRELVKAFCYDEFPFRDGDKSRGFARDVRPRVHFATLSAYESGLPVSVIVPKPPKMANIFAQQVSALGLRQFRCAETEKYPHVTFFFNDYREQPFDGEERLLIPSPRDVATYDLKPEMSALQITDGVVDRIRTGIDDVMVVNFANGDMVGHTGNLQAAIKAVEIVDVGVGRILDAMRRAGGMAIVTADHGNCEQMIDPETNLPHTAHTTYDVELIVVDDRFKGRRLRRGGRLADIAPTLLHLMELDPPPEMTGQSLLQ